MSNAITIESLRSAVESAEAHAAAAEANYKAYVDGPDGDAGEHVIDYSVAADQAVDAAREALREAIVASIEIGEVDEVYPRYDDGEEVALADMTGDLDYYVHVDVTIAGESYSVACAVGIQESEQGSARASGAMSCYCGGPDAWWVDGSDWHELDAEMVDGVLTALDSVAGRLFREAEAICEEARDELRTKDKVDSWETVASYVGTFPDDSLTGEGATDVEVQIGEAHGAWFLRTTDDAGGSDEADDTRYDSESEAREAAEEYASDHHEANDGEDAEDYVRRCLEERAGEPDPDGEWCVYWETTGDDEHVVDRYADEDAASAAAEIANKRLRERHPGGHLLCNYSVRHLVDGVWVLADCAEDAA